MDRKEIQNFAKFCMKVLRVNLVIEDQANLAKVDWSRPVFVMGNHGSYADIPISFLALERTVGFVAKRELVFIPFLGFWMKAIGCIFVNRGSRDVGKVVREAVQKSMKNVPRIYVFPEGTRSKNGKLSPFKSGGFRFATESDAIVLPIVIKGSHAIWEARMSSAPCTAYVKVLEPLDVVKLRAERNGVLEPKKDLLPMVRSMMEANL